MLLLRCDITTYSKLRALEVNKLNNSLTSFEGREIKMCQNPLNGFEAAIIKP